MPDLLQFSFPINEVPPDRYRFTCPDGHMVIENDRQEWYRAIRNHYRINGYAVPENLESIASDQLCRILPPGFCRYPTGEGFAGRVNARIGLDDYIHGAAVLISITRSPDPLVDQAEAERRAGICVACPANMTVEGCAPCRGISNYIMEVKGAKETKADQYLKACGICFCPGQANVWVKAEHLAKGSTEEQLQAMESMPGECWKAKAIRELQKPPQEPL